MKHSKVIVTTSINSPTEALRRFAMIPGWHLVVVGDLKTPRPYILDGVTYLSPEEQEAVAPRLSQLIGWNCIQRRNLGFVWAKRQGASIIATVDDDNIPMVGWGESLLVEREVNVTRYETNAPAFDPVGATEYPHLWHRGYPLQWLTSRCYTTKSIRSVYVDVEAGFWNGDPDIDAVCRMEHAPEVCFDDGIFPIASNAIAPFNSQNTILSAKMFPDYFLFPGIGRMDDIWAAFWLQSKGHKVVFNKSSVIQRRNEHDITRDFEAEILGYTTSHRLILALVQNGPDAIWDFLPDGSKVIYDAYCEQFE